MTAGKARSEGLSSFSFAVPGGASAAATARRTIVARDGTLGDDARERILLLVTELVTNAVRHAKVGPRESVKVTLQQSRADVRVEVLDRGPGFEPPSGQPGGPRGGWGLYLVEQIADRWGVTPMAPGACVWFEIDSSPDRAAAARGRRTNDAKFRKLQRAPDGAAARLRRAETAAAPTQATT